MSESVKIAMISDLHGKHQEWETNLRVSHWGWEVEQEYDNAEILIFAGDCSGRGDLNEVKDFVKWFSNQPQPIKIMISGNHDFLFHHIANDDPYQPQYPSIKDIIPDNVVYLNDSGYEYKGIKIWGSPVQPAFHNWAFNKNRGPEIRKHWDMIPDDTDVLIVHGPPRNILDRLLPRFQRPGENPNVGCDDLYYTTEQRVKPRLTVFGHIHEGHGKKEIEDRIYVNASCLDANYKPTNKPFIFDMKF
jgi:Icc-related predicted phosphoesterase